MTQYIGVVTQGGNTGLVGGAVGLGNVIKKDGCSDIATHDNGELILSMARMNKIIDLNPTTAVLQCEAGCILETLSKEAAAHGLMVPLDLGAKGSWYSC
jgi:FAD/FMN-containing dehydrogenase